MAPVPSIGINATLFAHDPPQFIQNGFGGSAISVNGWKQ
jgi:hypothetical protein